jgi:hypothetical protein
MFKEKSTLKTVAIAALTAFTIQTAAVPRPANAAVGLATGGTFAAAGGALIAVGVATGMFGIVGSLACITPYGGCGSGEQLFISALVGAAVLLTGIIVLNEAGQGATFQPMSPATALQFQITAPERAAFNNELEEMNSIHESVAADIQAGLSAQQIQERYEGSLSKPAAIAVEKLIRGAQKKN